MKGRSLKYPKLQLHWVIKEASVIQQISQLVVSVRDGYIYLMKKGFLCDVYVLRIT